MSSDKTKEKNLSQAVKDLLNETRKKESSKAVTTSDSGVGISLSSQKIHNLLIQTIKKVK